MVSSETHDKKFNTLSYLRLHHCEVLRMLPYLAQEYFLQNSNSRLKAQFLDSIDLLHVQIPLQLMHALLPRLEPGQVHVQTHLELFLQLHSQAVGIR